MVVSICPEFGSSIVKKKFEVIKTSTIKKKLGFRVTKLLSLISDCLARFITISLLLSSSSVNKQ